MTTWLRSKDEILEYPYNGTITRVIEGEGRDDDTSIVIYEGMMDEHLNTPEEGSSMQTATYIISIPLTKNNDEYVIPLKGDLIEINVYGYVFQLTVNNSEPSQLGGVSITATRNSW